MIPMAASRLSHLSRLALADLRADWPVALCQVMAVAAVLAPLLVLLGLKQGVVGTMLERRARHAHWRLIPLAVPGTHGFVAGGSAAMAARPETGFVLPATRKIAAQADLFPADGQAVRPGRVTLLPTAAGDPALAGAPAPGAFGATALSAAAAAAVGAVAEGRVLLSVERVRDGAVETLAVPLTVETVLPAQAQAGASALVPLEFALAVEAFRDGFAVPRLGSAAQGGPAPPAAVDAFVDFRLYARTIAQVSPLVAALKAQGLSVSARERDIAQALGLERNLSAVLVLIASVSLVGYGVMVGAGQWSAIQRKRRDLAVLALIGYGPGWRIALPILQGALIAAAGALLALGGYAAVAWAIDQHFSAAIAQGERACHLDFADMAAAVALTVAASLLPAAVAGILVARIDPSREIRDV